MPHDQAYLLAEKKIEEALKSGTRELDLSGMNLTELPESLGQLTRLQWLDLSNNYLTTLPESIGELKQLVDLILTSNKLTELPESLSLLEQLIWLYLKNNQLRDLPASLIQLQLLRGTLILVDNNPLNPELAKALEQGLNALKAYLRAKAEAIILNEAKLIVVGEGEVGKTCLMDALLDKRWQEHSSTHGIDIQQLRIKTQILRGKYL